MDNEENYPEPILPARVEYLTNHGPTDFDYRREALLQAVEIHSRLASFQMVEGGAHQIVKTAENFEKFLRGEGYETEEPSKAVKKVSGDGEKPDDENMPEVLNI